MTRTFVDLAEIDSPTCQEANIATFVTERLRTLGWTLENDRTGPATGNVIARRAGISSASTMLFSSHLDVVDPCRGVKPQIMDGRISSDGQTVLGADCKAGVAALIEAATVLEEAPQPDQRPALEFVFTWGEEAGHLGAKALDRALLDARLGFVLDGLAPVGTIIIEAPGYRSFSMSIKGRAAHAGVEPERGTSAILVASDALTRLPWGRLDSLTTSNVGIIGGGTARNAVPELVRLEGELRSLDPAALAARTAAIEEVFRSSCRAWGAELEINVDRVYEGYRLDSDDRPVALARDAAVAIDRDGALISSGGGSDANEFNQKGLRSCVLGIGAERCHSTRERIAIAELGRLANWVVEIIRGGTRTP